MKNKKIISLILAIAVLLFIFPKNIFAIQSISDKIFSIISGEIEISAILLIGIFIIFSLVFVPVAPLELFAGISFGPFWGTIYVVIAGTLAAMITLILGRLLFKGLVIKKISQKNFMHKALSQIEKKSWQTMALLRISSVIPFTFTNYLFSITNIKLFEYSIATTIFLIPPSMFYTYLGSLGKDYMLSPTNNILLKTLPIIGLLTIIFFASFHIKKLLNE